MTGNILVVGSINVDQTARLERLPQQGETCLARSVQQTLGGKGVNQAIAIHKWGGSVRFIGQVGNDESGRFALEQIRQFSLSVDQVRVVPGRTGSAWISIDSQGNNTIVVHSGANFYFDEERLLQEIFEQRQELSCCLMQLEIPFRIVLQVAKLCFRFGIPVILNPAPMIDAEQLQEIFPYIDLLIPNETELGALLPEALQTASCEAQCQYLLDKGVKRILVTLGTEGAWYMDSEQSHFEPALQVEAVDSTAAGDSFIGAYLVSRLEGKTVAEAMRIAAYVASRTVCTEGAAQSIPVREEEECQMRE